uniref:Uncharacterized protein n=1 Tax=Arundo donax TaxID=35708 RepID=A0A0A9ERS4_ARUDO
MLEVGGETSKVTFFFAYAH